ncbi:hypothetical protein PsAD2_03811 [Pseudovibrio axinellae]|uniref:Uncharacterized protein n=1 Tax=Pseudovibrio axinellae TaxID=989403 RepID=A0A165ULC2_9HYPH|nr:hypothetical protein PsAD2_03811 [Pseudovibrio axinellae]SEP69291.1 hypothetical protein SAMN05421798_101169 [Pseudovibrio axinellae]
MPSPVCSCGSAGIVYLGNDQMAARIALFFALVSGLVGITAAVGAMIPDNSGACVHYQTC